MGRPAPVEIDEAALPVVPSLIGVCALGPVIVSWLEEDGDGTYFGHYFLHQSVFVAVAGIGSGLGSSHDVADVDREQVVYLGVSVGIDAELLQLGLEIGGLNLVIWNIPQHDEGKGLVRLGG